MKKEHPVYHESSCRNCIAFKLESLDENEFSPFRSYCTVLNHDFVISKNVFDHFERAAGLTCNYFKKDQSK